MTIEQGETYIGDGVYVSLDDARQIRLRAPREHGDDFVYLEPVVLDKLLTWLGQHDIHGKF